MTHNLSYDQESRSDVGDSADEPETEGDCGVEETTSDTIKDPGCDEERKTHADGDEEDC